MILMVKKNTKNKQMIQLANKNILHKLISGKEIIKKKRLKAYILLESNQPLTYA